MHVRIDEPGYRCAVPCASIRIFAWLQYRNLPAPTAMIFPASMTKVSASRMAARKSPDNINPTLVMTTLPLD
jgi:hypothetical protein